MTIHQKILLQEIITITADNRTPCYKSFKNVVDLENVVAHYVDGSFFNIVGTNSSSVISISTKFKRGKI